MTIVALDILLSNLNSNEFEALQFSMLLGKVNALCVLFKTIMDL